MVPYQTPLRIINGNTRIMQLLKHILLRSISYVSNVLVLFNPNIELLNRPIGNMLYLRKMLKNKMSLLIPGTLINDFY